MVAIRDRGEAVGVVVGVGCDIPAVDASRCQAPDGVVAVADYPLVAGFAG